MAVDDVTNGKNHDLLFQATNIGAVSWYSQSPSFEDVDISVNEKIWILELQLADCKETIEEIRDWLALVHLDPKKKRVYEEAGKLWRMRMKLGAIRRKMFWIESELDHYDLEFQRFTLVTVKNVDPLKFLEWDADIEKECLGLMYHEGTSANPVVIKDD